MARSAIVAGATLVLFGLFLAIAVSPVPMRGAELFGALVRKIKGNRGATTAIVLGAGGGLWLLLGMIAAVQEWAARRRPS